MKKDPRGREDPLLDDGKASPKAALIHKVMVGEISPEEAERVAIEAGLGPLATEPDHSKFDPMRDPFWSTAMVLAWIMTGRENPVRLCCDRYRRSRIAWKKLSLTGPSGSWNGYELAQDDPIALYDLDRFEARWEIEGIIRTKLWDAEDDLLLRLKTGQTTMFASINNRERAEVSGFIFPNIYIASATSGKDRIYFCDDLTEPKYMIRGAVFNSTEIRKTWPSESQRLFSAGSESSARGWLIRTMKLEPNKIMKREDIKAECKARYPNMSDVAFDRILSAAKREVPEAHSWAKAGRPRKTT